MPESFGGKIVVITGASSGFGRGARVCALRSYVSLAGDVSRLAQTAIDKGQRIDLWTNDAGAGAVDRFEDVPLADGEQ